MRRRPHTFLQGYGRTATIGRARTYRQLQTHHETSICGDGIGVTGVTGPSLLGITLPTKYVWQFPADVQQYGIMSTIDREKVALVFAQYQNLPEISSATAFVKGGGTLVIESRESATTGHVEVNEFLQDLGVTMRQEPTPLMTAEYLDFQSHALTANCTKYNLSYVEVVNLTSQPWRYGSVVVNDGTSLAKNPAGDTDVIAVESLGEGRVVLIVSYVGNFSDVSSAATAIYLNTADDSDNEQFFLNLYEDAAGDCSTSCTTLGFFGTVDPDDWELNMPQGHTHEKALGDGDLVASEAHTVFMGWHPYDSSFSIPTDYTGTIDYLAAGGTVVVIVGNTDSTALPSPLTNAERVACNDFLQGIGCSIRWRRNNNETWYAGDTTDGQVLHSEVIAGTGRQGVQPTQYAATHDEVASLFVGRGSGTLELSGGTALVNGVDPNSVLVKVENVGGGRVFVFATSAFFTGSLAFDEDSFSAVGNEVLDEIDCANAVFLRNILTSATCPEE